MAKGKSSQLAFYHAKIGKGNQYVREYLEGRNELGRPCIPIYFSGLETDRISFLEGKSSKRQGEDFFNCSDNWGNSFAVVIAAGEVFVLKPVPHCLVKFERSRVDQGYEGMVKLMEVKQVLKSSVKDVPPIVAGMNANRYYSSGTFRKIEDPGNVLALTTLLVKHEAVMAQSAIDEPTLAGIIQCLSSVQLETLVAKLFEEQGCFVPAYKGGAVKGIDLTARNDTADSVLVGGFEIGCGVTASVQVKLSISGKERKMLIGSDQIDLLVWGIHAEGPSFPQREWIELALKQSPNSRDWLLKSISWLPEGYQKLVRCLGSTSPRRGA